MTRIIIFILAIFVSGCTLTRTIQSGDYKANIIGYWNNEDKSQASLEFLESGIVKIHHPVYDGSCIQFGIVVGEWRLHTDFVKFKFSSESDVTEYSRDIIKLTKKSLKLTWPTGVNVETYSRRSK